ncbi:MAG TPA: hypothetical protein VHB77_14120 [Planctomycetaceae bacterium]|nr:hypothetical protein [Planctomycetaceae bacterium]
MLLACRRVCVIALAALCWMVVPPLCAQIPTAAKPGDTPRAEGTPAENAAEPAPGASERPTRDREFVRNKAGELIEVLRDATWEGYLKFLEGPHEPPKETPPPFSVSRINLEGSVEGERANLTARVELQVHAAEGRVRVAVRMAEGVLKNVTHEGPGDEIFDRVDPESGYCWWLEGKGAHTLVLDLSVPLRKDAPGRRLQLSLPTAPVSQLTLQVPQPRITARAEERSNLELRSLDGHSEIKLIGLGPRLDLAWQPQPQVATVDPVLEVRTSISASLDGQSALLEANQKIVALQGAVGEIKVRIPPNSELLRLEGPTYEKHRLDPDNLNQVIVTLKEPSADKVDLRWTVRTEIGSPDRPVVLEGFEVERARIQTGYLAIRVIGTFRPTKISDDDRFVHPANVSDLAKVIPSIPAQGEIASAYRILKQPFRMALQLEKAQPYLTVQPYLLLNLSGDRADLDAIYQFRGSVDEVTIDWPRWKQEGWKIEPIVKSDGWKTESGNEGRVEQPIFDESAIRIRLAERTDGRFQVRFRAQRPLTPRAERLDFSLPLAQATSPSPAVVVLGMADNVEVDFKPTGETSLRPLPTHLLDSTPFSKQALESRRNAFWVDSPQPTFAGSVTVHRQRIATQTEADASLQGSQIVIDQRILYDVAYERLNHLTLAVPAAIVDRCTFFSAGGIELIPTAVGPTAENSRQLRVTLDQPRLGRFEVLARFTLDRAPAMGDQPSAQSIPFVHSVDAPFSTTRFRFTEGGAVDASVADSIWKKQTAAGFGPAWVADGEPAEIAVMLNRSGELAPESEAATRAWIRAVFERGGRAVYRAQFRLASAGQRLTVVFPPQVTPMRFYWGQELLKSAQAAPVSGKAGAWRLLAPESQDTKPPLITIEYQQESAGWFGNTGMHRLAAPRIGDASSPAETVWEISIPQEQHLFTQPEGFRPLYTWQRDGFFFARKDELSHDALAQWIGALDGPAESNLATPSNQYRFETFGTGIGGSFRSMSRHIIVLIGAGLALLVGFMLMYVPATRHVLTILLVAFATTAIALWFSEPVLVLLQPAALGLGLAVLAALLQGWLRRQRQGRVLALTPPSALLAPGSSLHRDLPNLPGNQETTALRPVGTSSVTGFGG